MAIKDKKGPEPYNLDPTFERQLVRLVVTSTRAFGMVGSSLEPDALSCEPARLAIAAAQQIAKESGKGPSEVYIVIQRVRRTMTEGRLTQEQVGAVFDYLDIDDSSLAEEAIVSEVAPILRKRAEERAVKTVIDSYTQRKDYAKAVAGLEKALNIGKIDISTGSVVGINSFEIIERVRTMQRLSTGVWDLDEHLSGGLGRGQLGFFVGGPGDGKSMALSHLMASSLYKGLFCLYATLELPESLVQARIVANLTDVPIDSIMDGHKQLAMERLMAMNHKLGIGLVKDFPAGATTVADIAEWVRMCEEQHGRPIDLLIVDYADKLTAAGSKEIGEYQAMKLVYEGLRLMAFQKSFWLWTASQARRKSADVKRLDLEHISDSAHKSRVADLIVTLNAREEGNMMEMFIAKNRTGKAHQATGAQLTDFRTGKIAPTAEVYKP